MRKLNFYGESVFVNVLLGIFVVCVSDVLKWIIVEIFLVGMDGWRDFEMCFKLFAYIGSICIRVKWFKNDLGKFLWLLFFWMGFCVVKILNDGGYLNVCLSFGINIFVWWFKIVLRFSSIGCGARFNLSSKI